MQPDLEELRITEKEVEELSGVTLSDVVMGNLYRTSVLRESLIGKKRRNRQQLASFIFNEVLIFGLTLIFSVPITLLIAKNTTSVPDTQAFFQFLQLTLVLSILLSCGWNIYMWLKAKPLAALANLADEVEKYNEVIKAVDIIDKLTAVGNLPLNLINRDDAIKALNVTRDSLICALRTEKILRDNQEFIGRRYELFVNIENNLTALMAFDVNNQASEYGRLLNEALEIGMSVHKEVRKLQDK
ncbi:MULTISPECIES: hypothetical protein [Kamptonema]|uniref:hypothetical protein n=1 Tax=Kamptonema TaxID=1501433 RepID=UPI0001DAC413|nr:MULTISPECIES: hypothetical protein [Kamptonema]CBN56092.1 conserved hypothetical protein [Kamptonema sp. PCC 6506]